MSELSYQTAGESHGPGLIAMVTGAPAGVPIDVDAINEQMRRRQGGYGRGGRQRIEHDAIEIISGVRQGLTIGSPIALLVKNKDNRLDDAERTPPLFRPRPGHADLAGAIKYLTPDCRGVLERASARETAAKVAAGGVARMILRALDIEVFGFVRAIGGEATGAEVTPDNRAEMLAARDASDTYSPDAEATQRQRAVIRKAKEDKDTVGGLIEVHVFNVPIGLGTCMDRQDSLDSRLAAAVMGVQAMKGVEIGLGMAVADLPGSRVHDQIEYEKGVHDRTLGFRRPTNRAGGLEGGMSNGQPIVVRAAMKPISTLLRGLPSVDLRSGEPMDSQYERSDVCAVSAASVVVEHAVAFEIARAALTKFGGDTIDEVRTRLWTFQKAGALIPQMGEEPGEPIA